MPLDGKRIQSVLVADSAARIADGDNLAAVAMKQTCGDAAGITVIGSGINSISSSGGHSANGGMVSADVVATMMIGSDVTTGCTFFAAIRVVILLQFPSHVESWHEMQTGGA